MAWFLMLMAAVLLSGCGYHTAGHAAQLPQNVNTIAIPAFKNETLTYHIEQMLTAVPRSDGIRSWRR